MVSRTAGPPAAGGVDELVEPVETRLRRQLAALLVGPQHAEQPPHLGQRLARRVADRRQPRLALRAACPGVVSRAVSACTATIDIWCATTSCSSRAIRPLAARRSAI